LIPRQKSRFIVPHNFRNAAARKRRHGNSRAISFENHARRRFYWRRRHNQQIEIREDLRNIILPARELYRQPCAGRHNFLVIAVTGKHWCADDREPAIGYSFCDSPRGVDKLQLTFFRFDSADNSNTRHPTTKSATRVSQLFDAIVDNGNSAPVEELP